MAALRIPGAPRVVAGRPVAVGPGRWRKVGLLGGAAGSLRCAPWQDPSWEFWAHASVANAIPHLRADRLFDPHPKHVFTMARKNGFKDYFAFLKTCPTPIYMQERYEDIPMSVRYPLEMVRQQWPGVPIGSTTALMVALALIEGVTHLGLFGIDYQHDSEYEEQRPNAELWVGIALGLGVQVIIPAISPLCHEPTLLYGYESHTPERFQARIDRFTAIKAAHAVPQTGFDPHRLVQTIGPEEAQALRARVDPVWAAEVATFANEVMPDQYRTDAERAQGGV